MAVIGVGIDVCDIERFGVSLERTPGLRERLFTPDEATRPLASLAARFAAKEAISKAFGTGISAELGWLDMEVARRDTGAPYVILHGKGKELLEARGGSNVHLSLSHTAHQATAMAILEG